MHLLETLTATLTAQLAVLEPPIPFWSHIRQVNRSRQNTWQRDPQYLQVCPSPASLSRGSFRFPELLRGHIPVDVEGGTPLQGDGTATILSIKLPPQMSES